MVKPISKVWFEADFPDDTIYRDNGDEAQFSGQNVSQAIAKLLAAGGYQMTEPESWDENGWSMDAHKDGRRFWILVTAIDDYILQTKNMTWRLWPDRAAFARYLLDLHSMLSGDPRFHNLRWFADEWPPLEAEMFPIPTAR